MICLIPPFIRGLTYLCRLPTCLGPPPKKAKVSTQKASPKKASVRKTRGASNQKDDPVPAKVVAKKSKGPKRAQFLRRRRPPSARLLKKRMFLSLPRLSPPSPRVKRRVWFRRPRLSLPRLSPRSPRVKRRILFRRQRRHPNPSPSHRVIPLN